MPLATQDNIETQRRKTELACLEAAARLCSKVQYSTDPETNLVTAQAILALCKAAENASVAEGRL